MDYTGTSPVRAVSVRITGIVQGVGFRPFVYNLARRLGVYGWVKNTTGGVICHAEGDERTLTAFVSALRDEAPPMAVIASLVAAHGAAEGYDDFSIIASEALEGAMTLVSPDIATCAACRSDFTDPENRRHGYPFTNCTNCGPRFTVIEDIPYDRPMTTMRDFPLCDECAAEYADPGDRRFHAQPNACFRCGPRLYLNVVKSQACPGADEWSSECEVVPRPHRDPAVERERAAAIIEETAALLRGGAIVAVKGLGGFQLACDARDEAAVLRLRERKHRWGKALAIMVRDLGEARALVELSAEEEALLASPQAPIVLARMRSAQADGARRDGAVWPDGADRAVASANAHLAPSLAPGLAELGVMLPYTPLHHLLLAEFGGPLVMTSGNRSDEPIATGNAEALLRLSDIADAFLLHDRAIATRYDDSVMRHTPDVGTEVIRRARGYAPFPLRAPIVSEVPILACGPEQKNTFCLLTGEHAFVSQHIGDMENAETLESFERTIALYERLFRITPELVAYDLHPEYLSSKFALALGLPTVGVQHHHAHIVSVTAEHGIATPVIGVAFDGTGYGSDGTIWGGEILVADWAGFDRVGHLRAMPLPGGVGAIRRPARMALGILDAFGLMEHPGTAPLRARLAPGEEQTVRAMIAHGLNTPQTSSMGRLFDAVAALAGMRDDALYEGQAAIELEVVADGAEFARLAAGGTPAASGGAATTPTPPPGAYAFTLLNAPDGFVIDSAPVIERMLDDIASGTTARVISARFHSAVVDTLVSACVRAAADSGITTVALAGGVFLNRLITRGALLGLRRAGLTPLTHRQLPVSDGSIAYGQAIAAWARRNVV